ncbi:hypothetical protein B0H63DRAFT_456236 [Podospora didyma]|uniref:Fungal-type protein kinase domain-containing protein n=1 Tax=Podospora didyma TaxID=330526 RepID=A0AAE0N1A3_9PEZI|nr:hypothetical protein B0H63DRAFT_456236 [Podospora didyma]
MAIGALLGEQHSFMHDLESFFWVLFWICIHCIGPDETRVVPQFDKWNYVDTEELAKQKLGTVAKESIFMKTITDNFTPFYPPLIPLLNRLRNIVSPKDKPWEREDEKLYSRMREFLRQVWCIVQTSTPSVGLRPRVAVADACRSPSAAEASAHYERADTSSS